jgi:hypothetical protein
MVDSQLIRCPSCGREQSRAPAKARTGAAAYMRAVQESAADREQTFRSHGCNFRGRDRALARTGAARPLGTVVRPVPYDCACA